MDCNHRFDYSEAAYERIEARVAELVQQGKIVLGKKGAAAQAKAEAAAPPNQLAIIPGVPMQQQPAVKAVAEAFGDLGPQLLQAAATRPTPQAPPPPPPPEVKAAVANAPAKVPKNQLESTAAVCKLAGGLRQKQRIHAAATRDSAWAGEQLRWYLGQEAKAKEERESGSLARRPDGCQGGVRRRLCGRRRRLSRRCAHERRESQSVPKESQSGPL